MQKHSSHYVYQDEIDAVKAYNLKAEELNKLETTKIKYELNNLEL